MTSAQSFLGTNRLSDWGRSANPPNTTSPAARGSTRNSGGVSFSWWGGTRANGGGKGTDVVGVELEGVGSPGSVGALNTFAEETDEEMVSRAAWRREVAGLDRRAKGKHQAPPRLDTKESQRNGYMQISSEPPPPPSPTAAARTPPQRPTGGLHSFAEVDEDMERDSEVQEYLERETSVTEVLDMHQLDKIEGSAEVPPVPSEGSEGAKVLRHPSGGSWTQIEQEHWARKSALEKKQHQMSLHDMGNTSAML